MVDEISVLSKELNIDKGKVIGVKLVRLSIAKVLVGQKRVVDHFNTIKKSFYDTGLQMDMA